MIKDQNPSRNAPSFNLINRFYKKYYSITFVTLSQNSKFSFPLSFNTICIFVNNIVLSSKYVYFQTRIQEL